MRGFFWPIGMVATESCAVHRNWAERLSKFWRKAETGCRLLEIKADLSDGPRELWLQTDEGIREVDVPPPLAATLLRRGQLEKAEKEELKRSMLGGTLYGCEDQDN